MNYIMRIIIEHLLCIKYLKSIYINIDCEYYVILQTIWIFWFKLITFRPTFKGLWEPLIRAGSSFILSVWNHFEDLGIFFGGSNWDLDEI